MKFITKDSYKKFSNMFAVVFTTVIILLSDFSFGQTWDGSESNDWNNGDNWIGGSVPDGGDVIIPSSGVTFMPVISVDPAHSMKSITVESGATLTQTDGTLIGAKLLINGTFNQSGGTLISDDDLIVDVGGDINQSGTAVIHLALSLSLNPVKAFKLKNGGTASQSGNAIIGCKDFKIETSNCSFTQSGDGLINLNHDWKNLGTFISVGGTVQFSGSAGGGPDFVSGTNQFFNVLIDDGVNPGFDILPNPNIKVGGNWTNNSSNLSLLFNNTTVEFNGSSAQTIGGSESTTFNNITIFNFSGDVNLAVDASVENILLFSLGKLNTGSNVLALGTSSGILFGETAGRYLVGNLITTKSVGTGSSILGNIGVSLNAGSDDLGNVTVRRISGPAGIINLNENPGIARNWTITSTNPPASGRNITFSWVADDDNGVELTNAFVYASSDSGVTWAPASVGQDVSSSRTINLDNATEFISYTVGNDPLPVELTSFTAINKENSVLLNWATATETNNSGFDIERKINNHWTRIAFVKGYGTTTKPQNYSFIEENLSTGKHPYRLKQIDFNGVFEYSDVVVVEIAKPVSFKLFQNHPNPFNPTTKINFQIHETEIVTLVVYDILGNEVATLLNEKKELGYYSVNYDASNLSSGTYIYQLRMGSFVETKKLILIK